MAYQDRKSGSERGREDRFGRSFRRNDHPFVSDGWGEENTQDRFERGANDRFGGRDGGNRRSYRSEGRGFGEREDRFGGRDGGNRRSYRSEGRGFGERGDRFGGRDGDNRRSYRSEGRGFGEKAHRPFRYSAGERDYNRNVHAENDRKKAEGYIRLNRYIANSGVCSRREADEMITSGVIMVNGEVCTVLGTLVGPQDKVQFGEQTLNAEKKVYLLMNKPKGYITTSDDPQDRKTVMELVADACKERIYPVGRLDRNTTGVLLFTNDGDMAKKLTHPSHGARKIYHVTLDNPLSKGDFSAIAKGLQLEDGWVDVDEITYVETGNRKEVGIQLHSGKNRIVRRIFEHFGYVVTKLDRVLFAELTKKDLRRGAWRFLTEQEVNFLKMNVGKEEGKPASKANRQPVFTPEQLAEADLLAEEEKPKADKRKTAKTRKQAVEVQVEEEIPSFIKPRRSKKAEEAEEAVEEKPKRRSTRKKAE